MNERKTAPEILDELLAYLGINASRLCKELKLTSTTGIYRIKNSKSNFTPKLAEKITEKYENINYPYLVSGIGKLTNDAQEPLPDNVFINTNGNKFTEKKDGSYDVTVRHLSFNQYHSYLKSLQSDAHSYDWDEATFCVDQFGKGNYQSFKTYSTSMDGGKLYDTPSGASLLGRELGKHHWKDGFRPSESGWVILTEKNIFHKDITHFDQQKKTIICSSRNNSPEFIDFELYLDHIIQIFKVIKRTF